MAEEASKSGICETSMGTRDTENKRLTLPRGCFLFFGPGFLDDFLRFPIATLVCQGMKSMRGPSRPTALGASTQVPHGHVTLSQMCT
jgi:hypothetical protein